MKQNSTAKPHISQSLNDLKRLRKVNLYPSCLDAVLVLRFFALNCCNHLCVALTWLCASAILTTMKFERCKEETVGSGVRLSIF